MCVWRKERQTGLGLAQALASLLLCLATGFQSRRLTLLASSLPQSWPGQNSHTPLSSFLQPPLKTTPAGLRPNKQGLAQTGGRIAMKLREVGVNFCWQQLDMGRMMMMIVEHTWRRRKVKKERCRRERYERRLTQRSLSSSNATWTTIPSSVALSPTLKPLRRFFLLTDAQNSVASQIWLGLAANRRQTKSANQCSAGANFGGTIIFANFRPN